MVETQRLRLTIVGASCATCVIPVAAFSLLGTHVYLAGLAMALSSVSVLTNSLTLRRFKLSRSE